MSPSVEERHSFLSGKTGARAPLIDRSACGDAVEACAIRAAKA